MLNLTVSLTDVSHRSIARVAAQAVGLSYELYERLYDFAEEHPGEEPAPKEWSTEGKSSDGHSPQFNGRRGPTFIDLRLSDSDRQKVIDDAPSDAMRHAWRTGELSPHLPCRLKVSTSPAADGRAFSPPEGSLMAQESYEEA